MKKPRSSAKARRFVHLGDRLAAIARVRAGECSEQDAARALGVDVDQLREWQLVHAKESIVRVADFRDGDDARLRRLRARAQRLADLVARAERELRLLHQRLLRDSKTSG